MIKLEFIYHFKVEVFSYKGEEYWFTGNIWFKCGASILELTSTKEDELNKAYAEWRDSGSPGVDS